MAAITVHKTKAIRCSPVTEEYNKLVQALRIETPEIPLRCVTLEIGLWITFLGVNEIRKLFGILDEKYRGIIANQIPVTLFCIELNCKTSGVTLCISTPLFSANS